MKTRNPVLALIAMGFIVTPSPAGWLQSAPQSTPANAKPTAQQKRMLSAFKSHVKDYLKQRKLADKQVPNISKEATPEQIQAYQKAFADALRGIRAGTQPGYIFTPEFTEHVRAVIKTEFPGKERVELRKTILEAENKAVPVKINFPYPETQELTQIPPTLLLKLPTLPKEVKFRFARRHLLLVDTDNGLIVDYALNVLP